MKRLLLLPILLALYWLAFGLFCLAAPDCFAQDAPYIVIGKDIWLLDEKGETKLFLLPETYYAPVVGIDETYYTVVFNGVRGKVSKSTVSVTGYDKETVGTSRTLFIDGKYSAFTAVKVFPSPELTMQGDFPEIPVGEAFTYLGSFPSSEGVWYYVRYGEETGYVLSDFCDKPSLTTEPFVPDVVEEKEKVEPETKEEGDLMKILIVAGVAVAVVVLLLLVLLPRKGKKTRYYYET